MRKSTLPSVTITVTLLGGGAPYLIGYSGFGLMEVRRFKPERTGARVLSGPHFRQPDVGVPTPYHLNVGRGARALLVRGRAFDRVNDLHVPLVYEPGSRVEIPLPAPPPISAGSLLRLAQLFRRAEWVFATSYAGGDAEHFYSRRSSWANDEDFVFATTAIARYGYRNFFRRAWWTQLDIEDHCYWTGWQEPSQHLWVNRRPLDRPGVPQRVRQVLLAEDARVLDAKDPHVLARLLFPEAGQ